MEKNISILNKRSIVKISGSDSIQFLNNILTCDISNLKEKEVCPSALLTPQGKILFDLLTFVLKDDSYSVFLECSKEQKSELINKLKLYSLRQNISIEETNLITIVTNNLNDFVDLKKDTRFYKSNISRNYLTKKELEKNLFKNFTEDIFWY